MAKKLCFYSLLVGVCLLLSFIESLFSLSFIAPGIKLGLANSVALILIYKGHTKGAFSVNIARILLSTVLFSAPVSLVYSLAGSVGSLLIILLVKRIKGVSVIGASMAGGAVHNILQMVIAVLLLGRGVLYYGVILVVAGTVCGGLVGSLSSIILKKVKTNSFF